VHTIIKGGFAVRFVKPSVSERTLLGVFVEHVLNGRASSAEGGRVKRKVGRLYKMRIKSRKSRVLTTKDLWDWLSGFYGSATRKSLILSP